MKKMSTKITIVMLIIVIVGMISGTATTLAGYKTLKTFAFQIFMP